MCFINYLISKQSFSSKSQVSNTNFAIYWVAKFIYLATKLLNTYLSTLVTFSNVVRLVVWFRTLSLIPITKRGFRTIVLILTLDFG